MALADFDFKYKVLDDGTISITEYTGSDTDIVIPSVIDGKVVTTIGNRAFLKCKRLRSVSVSDSVTTIRNTFARCKNLININVSVENENYSSIDGVLFSKDKKTLIKCLRGRSGNYTIPDSVTTIGNFAFYGCKSLTSVSIPNSVTKIGNSAFDSCESLTSIDIPSSVTTIRYAFARCKNLININVSVENENYSSMDGVLFSKDKKTLIKCPREKSGSYTIPYSVTAIEKGAFAGCGQITSINIPDSVTTIGDYAFFNCSLISVDIPNSVITIGDSAFFDCDSLISLSIPNSVTTIGYCTFWNCDNLTIYCVKGSYAETYAKEKGIKFVL